MATLKTKFSLGQTVWDLNYRRSSNWFKCQVCLGRKNITVKTHDGNSIVTSEKEFNCPECRGEGGKTVYDDKTEYFVLGPFVIGKISVEVYEDISKNRIAYMFYETGVGSGTCHNEEDIFSTKESAEKEARKKNKNVGIRKVV